MPPPRPPQKSPIVVGGWGLLLVVAVVLLVLRPTWLFPAPVAPEPLAVKEANLRMVLYIEAQRVNGYRELRGELPASLAQAGSQDDGLVTYRRLDAGRYELVGRAGTLTITYRSGEPLDALLGQSFKVIRDRTR